MRQYFYIDQSQELLIQFGIYFAAKKGLLINMEMPKRPMSNIYVKV